MFKFNRKKMVVNKRNYTSYKFIPLNNIRQNVFIKNQRRNGVKTLDCIVCGTYLVFGVDPVQHVEGHKHQNNLDELEKSWIWKEIRSIKKTLVGLEYLVELVRTPEVNILHVCMLCGINGKSCEILEHFGGLEHQKKFLETHFPSYYRHIKDEKLLTILCVEIEELKGRLRPMVCFFEEFDKNPLEVWKRIENGEHFKEENCMKLLEILRKQRKTKLESSDEPSTAKCIKLENVTIPQVKMEVIEPDVESQEAATAEEVRKYLNATQDYFKVLSSTDLRTLKNSIKLAEELAAQNVKPSPDVHNASRAERYKDNDSLTENDINILIDNFELLKSEDQNNLILFLQKLEIENPEKFKNLH